MQFLKYNFMEIPILPYDRQNQNDFFAIIVSLCYIYYALVIHIPLNEAKLAKILPPYQHIVSLLEGAKQRHLA